MFAGSPDIEDDLTGAGLGVEGDPGGGVEGDPEGAGSGVMAAPSLARPPNVGNHSCYDPAAMPYAIATGRLTRALMCSVHEWKIGVMPGRPSVRSAWLSGSVTSWSSRVTPAPPARTRSPRPLRTRRLA